MSKIQPATENRRIKSSKGSSGGKNPAKTSGSATGRLGKAEYFERLAPLELELNQMANWLQHTGKRLLVIIEGRDTAGKGGVISAITDTLNPANAMSWRCRSPPNASARSGTFSVMCNTCPPLARSCCLTVAGTTGPASSA